MLKRKKGNLTRFCNLSFTSCMYMIFEMFSDELFVRNPLFTNKYVAIRHYIRLWRHIAYRLFVHSLAFTRSKRCLLLSMTTNREQNWPRAWSKETDPKHLYSLVRQWLLWTAKKELEKLDRMWLCPRKVVAHFLWILDPGGGGVLPRNCIPLLGRHRKTPTLSGTNFPRPSVALKLAKMVP